jgi:hypothetical protein
VGDPPHEQFSAGVRAVLRATDAGDRVRRLEELGFTQKALAWMVHANERSVRNWRTTGRISPLYDARLRDLAALVAELDGSLSPRGIVPWFNASLRYLGDERPADLLHIGEIERVTEAARAFAAGSYL